jgi:hypothetical protein
VDGTDWAGGNTKEWGRWVTDMAAPASEPEGRPLDAAQETGSSSRASEARLEPEAPTDTPGTATDPANAP